MDLSRIAKVERHCFIGNRHACRERPSILPTDCLVVHILKGAPSSDAWCQCARDRIGSQDGFPEDDEDNIFVRWEEGTQHLTPSIVQKACRPAEGRSVFFHCRAGAHRAPTLGVAHLVLNWGFDVLDALALVNEARRSYSKRPGPMGIRACEMKLIQTMASHWSLENR